MTAASTFLLMAVLALADARGDAKDRAKDLTRQATVAYNLGHYQEAAEDYEAAYRLVQDPVLLFNIGQSYRLAAKPEQALAAYKGFLRTGHPDERTRASVEARVAELEKTLAERRAAEPAPPPPPPPTATPSSPIPVPPTSFPGEPNLASNVTIYHAPEAPTVEEEAPPRYRTTLGGRLGWAGRGAAEENAFNFRFFGRLQDAGRRVYELGFVKRPLYPMNPVHQYTALYGAFQLPSGWMGEAGALGAHGEWHLGAGLDREYFDVAARMEHVSPGGLCNNSDGSVLYFVPEGRIKVPVSSRLRVVGLAGYRGTMSSSSCDFHPSLLTLDLSGEMALPQHWQASAGFGHYGLFGLGPGTADPPWPGGSSAEHLHAGARYAAGKITFTGEYRLIFYGGGTHQLLFGVEFRSIPDAP